MRKLLIENFMTRRYLNDTALPIWIFLSQVFVTMLAFLSFIPVSVQTAVYYNWISFGFYAGFRIFKYFVAKAVSKYLLNESYSKPLIIRIAELKPIKFLFKADDLPFKRTFHYADAVSQLTLLLWMLTETYGYDNTVSAVFFLISMLFSLINIYFYFFPLTLMEMFTVYKINDDEIAEIYRYKDAGYPDVTDPIEVSRIRYLVNLYVVSGYSSASIEGLKEWYERVDPQTDFVQN